MAMKCGCKACFCFIGVCCHIQSTEVKQNDMRFVTANFGFNISVRSHIAKLLKRMKKNSRKNANTPVV